MCVNYPISAAFSCLVNECFPMATEVQATSRFTVSVLDWILIASSTLLFQWACLFLALKTDFYNQV